MAKPIRIFDRYSGASAEIVPELGFNCISFTAIHDGREVSVIDSPGDVLSGEYSPSSYGIPILFPFPNRIRDGKFRWQDQDYSIPLKEGEVNAIHGFSLNQSWRVTSQTDDAVVATFQLSVDAPEFLESWPADFSLSVRYRVAENRLEMQFQITNCSSFDLPWGLGIHPYFKLPFAKDSQAKDCEFQVPVTEQWELENFLPSGKRLAVENNSPLRKTAVFGTHQYDDVFTGWDSDGGTVRSQIVDPQGGIQLTQICDSQFFREAVVYTPPGRNALCIEPYTCVTDAINLESKNFNTGLQVLASGQVAQTWCALQVSSVYA